MGIEKVKDEIIQKAKDQDSLIVHQAKTEANGILKEAERKIEDYRNKSSAETKRKLIDIKRQEITKAEMEARKLSLQAKKQLIDNVFDIANNEIMKLKEKEMSKLI